VSRWRWILTQLNRRLWVHATLIGFLGVATAILAAFVERFIPWQLPTHIGADAVESILTIIASSMLAVTTFSLSVMTSAYGAATSNVTPRATRLLLEDRITQSVLSNFIGSFLFSIVGIVVLKTGAYGERGRVVLFVVTIVVIALVIISLLRWIDHLTRLGRVGETTQRVEDTTRQAIDLRLAQPFLGGRPLPSEPAGATPIPANTIGYVQYIDMNVLSDCCQHQDADLFVAAIPGTFVYPDTPLAWLDERTSPTTADALREAVDKAFSVGNERNFDQDPRFGLAVMCEIGSRALSPATNDPGTAIDVIGRLTRLLSLWARNQHQNVDVMYPRIHVPPLKTEDLFEDAFMLLARDGAGLIEVQLRLQKSLHALSRMGDADFRAAALRQARLAHERANDALPSAADRTRLGESAFFHTNEQDIL